MNKSKIEWCDSTWNPITGCLHNCTYCYARRMANRFDKKMRSHMTGNHILDEKQLVTNASIGSTEIDPYPYGFEPTFHRYRLHEPQQIKKSQNIFVCSMADLFGEWVPGEWIEEVFDACKSAPQHRYIFLTKNPKGIKYPFHLFFNNNDKAWIGTSITKESDLSRADTLYMETTTNTNRFLSIEPLLADIGWIGLSGYKWVIVGAQTGPGAKPPEPEWVQLIIDQCREAGIPIFLKNNLNWPMKIQEFPWKE